MRTDRNFLARAREIWEAALGTKMAGQLSAAQVGALVTSKKRKNPIAFGGPSVSHVSEVAPVPPTIIASLVVIPIIDLEGADGSSSLTAGVPT